MFTGRLMNGSRRSAVGWRAVGVATARNGTTLGTDRRAQRAETSVGIPVLEVHGNLAPPVGILIVHRRRQVDLLHLAEYVLELHGHQRARRARDVRVQGE